MKTRACATFDVPSRMEAFFIENPVSNRLTGLLATHPRWTSASKPSSASPARWTRGRQAGLRSSARHAPEADDG